MPMQRRGTLVIMKSPRIVIVGAGASGIAAAAKLCENGFTNVVILEAEDRIGGRICSVKFENDIVELGAMFCRENGLVHKVVKDLLEPRNAGMDVYHSKHRRLSADFVNRLIQRLSLLHLEKGEQVSWQQHLDEQFERCVLDHFENEAERQLIKECDQLVETMFKFTTCSTHLSEGYETFAEPLLSFQYIWKTGSFKTLFDCIMQDNLKIQQKIALKTEVVKIDWRDDEIKLSCSNGSSYVADCVIVTVPLGVLKRRGILFQPSLPKEKEQAIELLKFTSPSQVIVHFPNKWWENNDIFFTWTKEDMKSIDFNKGPSKNGMSWLTNVIGYVVSPLYKNCLTLLFVGELLKEIELLDDGTWLEGVHYLNERFLAETFPNLSKPTKIARMNWFSNPHFGGTICTDSLETKRTGLGKHTLAIPLLSAKGKPRVLFAGEATNDGPHSFVNSALYTGVREADRIINFYKDKQ